MTTFYTGNDFQNLIFVKTKQKKHKKKVTFTRKALKKLAIQKKIDS